MDSSTPTRIRQAMEGGRESPAVKRAKVEPMAAPTIVHEAWDHQMLFREVARMKAQLVVMTDYVQSIGAKHNTFVDDTGNGGANSAAAAGVTSAPGESAPTAPPMRTRRAEILRPRRRHLQAGTPANSGAAAAAASRAPAGARPRLHRRRHRRRHR